MGVLTDIWIGSVLSLPSQSITFNASGQTLTAGNYYLEHTNVSLSLLDQLASIMAAAGLTNPLVLLNQDLKVVMSSDDPFSVTWTDTDARDLAGFTGNLTSNTSHTAPNVSPLLWSPQAPGTPAVRRGIDGYKTYARSVRFSQDGSTGEAITKSTRTLQEYSWDLIPIDRLMGTTDPHPGGTFQRLLDEVLLPGAPVRVYEDVTEEAGSSSTMDLGSSVRGPYRLRETFDPRWYRRKIQNSDLYGTLSAIELIKQSELS